VAVDQTCHDTEAANGSASVGVEEDNQSRPSSTRLFGAMTLSEEGWHIETWLERETMASAALYQENIHENEQEGAQETDHVLKTATDRDKLAEGGVVVVEVVEAGRHVDGVVSVILIVPYGDGMTGPTTCVFWVSEALVNEKDHVFRA